MFPKKSESPISKKVKEWFPTRVPVRDDGTWKYCPYCLPEASLLCFPHLGHGISRSTFFSFQMAIQLSRHHYENVHPSPTALRCHLCHKTAVFLCASVSELCVLPHLSIYSFLAPKGTLISCGVTQSLPM